MQQQSGFLGSVLLMMACSVMAEHDIELVNKCARDILVYYKDGTTGMDSLPMTAPLLTPGATITQRVNDGFWGVFYARFGTFADYTKQPDTTVGFQLDQGYMGDFYYLDVINGYTLPAKVEPLPGTFGVYANAPNDCRPLTCQVDLAKTCPAPLQVKKNNQIVACQPACTRFGKCPSPHDHLNRPNMPSGYAMVFWKACPDARSYGNVADFSTRCTGKPAQVDANGYGVHGTTYTTTGYKITFC